VNKIVNIFGVNKQDKIESRNDDKLIIV